MSGVVGDGVKELERRLAKQLAVYRRATGRSQVELARAISYDRTHIAHAERAKYVPAREFWQSCDLALSARGRLLELYDQWQALKTDAARTARAHAIADRRAKAEALLEASRLEPGRQAFSLAAGEVDGAAPLIGSTSLDLLDPESDAVRAAACVSAEFAARVQANNAGPATIEELHEGIAVVCRAYVYAPLGPLFSDLIWLRDRIFELLEGRQPLGLRRELLFLAGAVCGLLAHASDDAGEPAAATTQVRTALVCAEQAGHAELRGWLLGTRSKVIDWSGQPTVAAELAGTGLAAARGSGAVRLAALQARAWAHAGADRLATAALARAEQLRENDDRTSELDQFGGIFTFPAAKQSYYEASTHVWLGNASRAQQAAQKALDTYRAGPAAQRSYGDEACAIIDLAAALVIDHELEAAIDAVGPVLDLPPERRIDGLAAHLGRVRREVEAPAYRRNRLAGQLRQRIEGFEVGPIRALGRT